MERAVFINYRGEDSHSYGALLYHALSSRFGEDLVFLDAESIPAGADFAEELLSRVRSARVLLAVIGPRWLTATDRMTGQRRIDDPADWLRRELAAAFTAHVRVIPVLTDQAALPHEADLPADIGALSRCQCRYLRRREPGADLARIVADLASLDPDLAAAAHRRDAVQRERIDAVGGVAEQLAQAVGARWRREEERRQIQDPFPLPVRWRLAPDGYTDHWANISRVPAGATAGPLALTGQLSEIVEIYRRVPSGGSWCWAGPGRVRQS